MNKPAALLIMSAAGLLLVNGCSKTPSSSSESSSKQTSLPSPPTEDPLAKGLWWLYQLQYDQARTLFTKYVTDHPADPAGYFYQSAVDWWQLAHDFELNNPEIRQRFERDSKRTIAVADASEKRGDTSERARAYLYRGGAWGLRGRLEVTQRHWLDAYLAGRRGHADLKEAVSLDPNQEDAYLGLGIYDYYAATLKGVQAALSTILMHGDRKRGLEELKRVQEKGKHSRVEAMLFLIEIYTSSEKEPALALTLAEDLHREYPSSPAMHLALLSTLAATKNWGKLDQEATLFLKNAQQSTPYYNHAEMPAGLYYQGLSELYEGHPENCVKNMNDIVTFPDLPSQSRWITFAYLRRAQVEDEMSMRTHAKTDYERVLARPDIWFSHDEASHGLQSPFKIEKRSKE